MLYEVINYGFFLADGQRLKSGSRRFEIKSSYRINNSGVGFDSGTGLLILTEPKTGKEPEKTDIHNSYYILIEIDIYGKVIKEVKRSFQHIHSLIDEGKLKCCR